MKDYYIYKDSSYLLFEIELILCNLDLELQRKELKEEIGLNDEQINYVLNNKLEDPNLVKDSLIKLDKDYNYEIIFKKDIKLYRKSLINFIVLFILFTATIITSIMISIYDKNDRTAFNINALRFFVPTSLFLLSIYFLYYPFKYSIIYIKLKKDLKKNKYKEKTLCNIVKCKRLVTFENGRNSLDGVIIYNKEKGVIKKYYLVIKDYTINKIKKANALNKISIQVRYLESSRVICYSKNKIKIVNTLNMED